MEKQNKCNKCGSTLTYIRISTGERVCRSCGNIENTAVEATQNANTEVLEGGMRDNENTIA